MTALSETLEAMRGPVARVRRVLGSMLLLLMTASCSGIPISYYDATTYTQLTGLKAETTMLVESFDSTSAADNKPKIESVTLNLRKAYEYEKGKGLPNSDTAEQFEIINGLFHRTVSEYVENGPGELGPKYFREASVVLGQAFDIAISSENLKNKDKR